MKKQKAIVNCENVKLYCLPKWYINCIIQSNKRRRKVKDSNQNIAKAVLKIRQDNKLSQEQFAEMVGVTRQAVSRWEMGVSVPNINTLILISEKFDIPVDEMLKSGDVVEKIDNNKTSFKKDRNYSIVFLTIGILGLISIPFEMSADDHNCTSHFRGVQLRKHSKAREKRYSFGYAVSFIFACYQILWTFPKSRYLCSRYLPLVCG